MIDVLSNLIREPEQQQQQVPRAMVQISPVARAILPPLIFFEMRNQAGGVQMSWVEEISKSEMEFTSSVLKLNGKANEVECTCVTLEP